MSVICFWLKPTESEARWLRRFTYSDVTRCPSDNSGHDSWVRVEDAPATSESTPPSQYEMDSRWPTRCQCGYVFLETDSRQVFTADLYTRSDTQELITIRDAPPGAMWDAHWMSTLGKGPDGKTLVVKCPNGREWIIDSQCSNCTIPDDHSQELHHCWVRHGEPPVITVDKNGVTCGAGAGSIQAGDYHGFLRNGVFEP